MPLKERLIEGGQQYSANIASFLAVIVLLRFYEALVHGLIYHFPPNSFHFELFGLKYDLLIFLKTYALLAAPFVLLYLLKPRIARTFFIVVACMLIAGSVALEQYFANSMVPLGPDLFAYSLSEITHTVGAAGGFSISQLLPFLVFLAITLLFWFIMKNRKFKANVFYVLLILSIGSLFISGAAPDAKKYKTDFDSYLACNKLGFFASKSFDYVLRKYQEKKDLENYEADETGMEPSSSDYSFCYVNKDYPMMHIDESQDVLGKFFKPGKTSPNFVFIIVESLGRAYCGENAYLGSFTPFLDSLMQKSLYWENFLSTGGRTFAVLPSTFASAPFGEKGFAEMGENMPRHLSLIKLLKERGYYSRFIYGGDAHFDLMDVFLKRQGIDQIVDSKTFGAGYSKLPANDEGFTWGYGDKEIFRKLLEVSGKTTDKPRLDIVMTLAMHSPFKVNDQEFYDQKFEKRLNDLKLNEQKKADRRSYAKQYATMLYFDDALRSLFNEYAKRKDFKNTIFIITGDHRMPEIPISTQLDRFHVPLIIYSPMLKTSARFSSISAQFDITPTITAFLRQNYHFQFPLYASWIGYGLDTVRTFRNIHSYPLMRNKNELVDYLDGTNFLSNHDLYKIYPSLDIEVEEDNSHQAELSRKLSDYKVINTFVCSQNRIIPDSIYNDLNLSTLPNDSARIETIAVLKKKYQAQASENGSYSIVANVFSSNGEALNYSEKLKKQGYEAHIMAEDTKFIVLVGKYSSKKQASSDLARIKSSVAANAWVLENR
jgi:uncharacterized sulfatase